MSKSKAADKSTYRRCYYHDILCYDGSDSDDNLKQMGCGHFYHKECLARSLINEINIAKSCLQLIVCPECKVKEIICSCPDCSLTNTHNSHQFTQREVKSLVNEDYFVEKYVVSFDLFIDFPQN